MDLELLKRANEYVLKMANGINPLTGEAVNEDDLINNIKVSRCLFYVNSVLNNVLANGGIAKNKIKLEKVKFSIDRKTLEKYEFIEYDVSISKIVRNINELINDDKMKKLKSNQVTEWLMSLGLLEEKVNNGKKLKVPTELGKSVGMYIEHRVGNFSEYDIVIYKREMQEFIINNFEILLDFINQEN